VRKPRELAVDVDALRREYTRGRDAAFLDAVMALEKPLLRLRATVVDAVDAFRTELEQVYAEPSFNEHSSTDPLPVHPEQPEPKRFAVRDAGPSSPPRDSARATAARHNGSGSSLSKAERLILTALAQYPQGRTKNQVAILAGYAVNGGGFSNAISSLRTKAFLEGDAHRLVITPGGIAALGDFEPLPRGYALLDHWYRHLGKAERKALETLAEVYPRTLSKAQLANRAGYEANGGGFNNALSRLRTLELVHGRAELKASADLFG